MNDALLGSGALMPDFAIFTSGMTLDPLAPAERPIVRMVGSSTEQDLHRDTMTASALHDMSSRAPDGLLIWLNHDYTLPKSLFGSLIEAPMIIQKSGIADLHIAVEVELSNPEAAQTYQYIQRGRRLGCSVGCQVEDYELVDTGKKNEAPLVHITHVRPVEWSVVGIPANQRSWVENAAQGLFERMLRTGREDEALRLAPIAKSLSARDFKTAIKQYVSDPDFKRELLGIAARPTSSQRLYWESNTNKFVIIEGKSGQVVRSVEREQIGSTLETLRKSLALGIDETSSMDEGHVALTRDAEPLLTEAADSSHDAKLTAQKRRQSACGIAPKEGGHLTCPGEWSQYASEAAIWGDYTNYRYPMPDKTHADDAASRWGDESNRSQYSSEEQAIISRRIAARQRHFGEKDEKSVNVIDIVKYADGGVLYTFDDGSQRYETSETVDGVAVIKALEISKDGTHDPMTGDHAHKHSSGDGDGDMHNHGHSHDGDASHAHSHPADADGDNDGDTDGGAKDDDNDASKSVEPELVAGVQGGSEPRVETTAINDTHDADAPVTAKSEVEGDGESGDTSVETEADGIEMTEVQKQALALYNSVGASLGLPAVTDVTKARSSGGNEKSNEVKTLALAIDQDVDKLLKVLGVPDDDDDDAVKSADEAFEIKSGKALSAANTERLKVVHHMMAGMVGGVHCAAFAGGDTEKAGRSISAPNMARLKQAHDTLASMVNGVHCSDYLAQHGDAPAAMADDSMKDFEVDLGEVVMDAVKKAMGERLERLDALTQALEGFDVKALGADVDRMRREMALARKALLDTRAEAEFLNAKVAEVSGKGLGRPTTFAQRSAPEGQAVGLEPGSPDPQTLPAATTLEEALEQTRKEYVAGVGLMRVWPKGVGVGLRPELSSSEMSAMNSIDILRYLDGGEARVPLLSGK